MPIEWDVRVYALPDGSEPFSTWLRQLRDGIARQQIRKRIARLRLGNFGDAHPVGEGVFELRVHIGPGYRMYYGRSGERVVMLLCGGDKGSQPRDIERAKRYWQDYLGESNG